MMPSYKEFKRNIKDFLLLKLYIEESSKIIKTSENVIDISIIFGDEIKSGICFDRTEHEETPLIELINVFEDVVLEEVINSNSLADIIYAIKEELGDDED